MKSTNQLDVLINEAFFKTGTSIREEHNNIVDGKRAHADYHSTRCHKYRYHAFLEAIVTDDLK